MWLLQSPCSAGISGRTIQLPREVTISERKESSYDSPYFRPPATDWEQLSNEDLEVLTNVADALAELARQVRSGRADSESPGKLTTPGEMAWRLYDAAGRLTIASGSDEKDLRQMITTLGTALTVAWDMYDRPQSESTTVQEHIERLRTTIQDFEADLSALQSSRASEAQLLS